MKKIIVTFLVLSFVYLNVWNVFALPDWMWGSDTKVEYNCWDKGCGLETWIDLAINWLNELETERPFSEYIQAITIYLLSFITLIAILYVIYAGFRILTWNGDEEKLKASKNTIVYVVLGIALIWLAVPLVKWIIGVVGVGV